MKRRGVKDWNVSGLYLVRTFSVLSPYPIVRTKYGDTAEVLRRHYGDRTETLWTMNMSFYNYLIVTDINSLNVITVLFSSNNL